MVEPTACAVHGALAAGVADGDTVVVIGSGTLGLLVVAALRRHTPAGAIIVGAKYPTQRELARDLGADLGRRAERASSRRAAGDRHDGPGRRRHPAAHGGRRRGGRLRRQRVEPRRRARRRAPARSRHHGRHAGSCARRPDRAVATRDHAGRGLRVRHRGSRPPGEPPRRTFDLAFELVETADLGRLVSATYPLARFADAVDPRRRRRPPRRGQDRLRPPSRERAQPMNATRRSRQAKPPTNRPRIGEAGSVGLPTEQET